MISLLLLKATHSLYKRHKLKKLRKHRQNLMRENWLMKRESIFARMKRLRCIKNKKASRKSLYEKMKEKRK